MILNLNDFNTNLTDLCGWPQSKIHNICDYTLKNHFGRLICMSHVSNAKKILCNHLTEIANFRAGPVSSATAARIHQSIEWHPSLSSTFLDALPAVFHWVIVANLQKNLSC